MKSQNFNRRNFLRVSAASVAALGVTKATEAKNDTTENNEPLKTPNSTKDVTDHGALEGLSNDDHPQYLSNQRGDARYYQKSATDTQLIGKVNVSDKNQPNGYLGLDANGKINLAQVGNFTSPENGQALRLRDGAIINVSETYRRLDTEFGVVADGSTNNAAAIQTALNAVRESNGGTLVFPNGVTKVAGTSSINLFNKQGAIRLLGSGGNSVVHIAGGSTETAFEFHSAPNLTVEGLTFIGTPGNYVYDFTQAVFFASYVEQVTFRDCQFLGLSVDAQYDEPATGFALTKYHGIVVCNEGDLLIERCIFGGCATNQCPNVGVSSWNGLTIRDSQFLDYGYYKDLTLSKTGGITNTYWVRAVNPNAVTNARVRGKVSIENTIFDEANVHAVYLYGAQWVELDSLCINGGLYDSIYLVNVNRANIKDSFVGYSNTEFAMTAHDCGVVQLDNLLLGGNVKYIRISGRTQKIISRYSDLPGGALGANGIVNSADAKVDIII